MSFADLIVRTRDDLERFDYDHYPPSFSAFEQAAAPLFAALEAGGVEAAAAGLLEEMELRREGLSRRRRQKALDQDKQVLAIFLTPAARRAGETAERFAESLCAQWNLRYPRCRYLPGDYETIMKGFDVNFLGILLRKSGPAV